MINLNRAGNRQDHYLMKLFLVSASSVAATLMLVFILVLPMIYGIDPTGFGARLGLNGIPDSENQQTGILTGKDPVPQTQSPLNSSGHTVNQANAVVQGQPGEHQETFTLVVPPKQNLIFKLAMEKDYELDYHWATDGKPLYAELRGQKQGAPENEVKVFGKLTESKAKGFFIAPFNGNYSLYWKNKSDQEVKVRLFAKGVYKALNQL
jgi:hypothetical protein